MRPGGKFNYKIEIAAENVMQFLNNQRFPEAFEISDRFLKRKPVHPVFVFSQSIKFLLDGNTSVFREIFDGVSRLKFVQHLDYYNFGVFFQTAGAFDLAAECFDFCLRLKPDFIEGWIQLGNSFQEIQETETALGAYLSGLAEDKDNFICNQLAAGCFKNLGHEDKALEHYRICYEKRPLDSNCRCDVAKCLIQLGRLEEAEYVVSNDLGKATNREKDLLVLSKIYKDRGDKDKALKLAAAAYEANSDNLHVLKVFGVLLADNAINNEAKGILKKAIIRDQEDAELLFNYAVACQQLNEFVEAEIYYNKAIAKKPGYHECYNNIGFVYEHLGESKKAIEYYRKALEFAPEKSEYHSNVLFTLLQTPGSDPVEHYNEARDWQRLHAATGDQRVKEYNFPKNKDTKLRIGYISGDFGDHVVSYYWLPIVKHHNREKFEIYLYSQIERKGNISETVTKEIKENCDQLAYVADLSDADLSQKIVDDGIHILIDLSGHTSGNRLKALSRKPASVQATYIGYPGTTGLDSIDYFITQAITVPLSDADLFSEKLVHLPGITSYNVRKGAENISTKPLPFQENGYVTFGSFNRSHKISKNCIETWARILERVPDSRLLVKRSGAEGDHFTEQMLASLKAVGVDRERLIFRERGDYLEYLEEINEVDIGLDTFPFNGATTSLDMLYMGRAFIALKGGRALQENIGASLLRYFGHEELISHDISEYINKAVGIAERLPHLDNVRLDLRKTYKEEIAGSGKRSCSALEQAYTIMWDRYCKGQQNEHIVIEG
ncbi:tetratricopeptide repeat protein [Kiloniella laminariae]|uniref:protein O-GlcNAc transferase n=1 Tax=Kiloniella laminariae TaxID=454162 RepID=A0ABT4LHC9_9PROT|nr:glycosyltransferase family 41 protein [Kiloniella laminariae]MCZ4280510.1 tetratricopeptide repeat protein [Kiloniella laminariae]